MEKTSNFLAFYPLSSSASDPLCRSRRWKYTILLSWAVEIRKEDQNFVRQKGTKKKKEDIAAPAFLFEGEKVADEEKRASSSPCSRGGRRSRNQLPYHGRIVSSFSLRWLVGYIKRRPIHINHWKVNVLILGNWQAVDLELQVELSFAMGEWVAVDVWGCLLLERWRILTTRISVMRDVSAPFFILKEAATSNTSQRKMKQASLLTQPESSSH